MTHSRFTTRCLAALAILGFILLTACGSSVAYDSNPSPQTVASNAPFTAAGKVTAIAYDTASNVTTLFTTVGKTRFTFDPKPGPEVGDCVTIAADGNGIPLPTVARADIRIVRCPPG